jgi:hypothetical protein
MWCFIFFPLCKIYAYTPMSANLPDAIQAVRKNALTGDPRYKAYCFRYLGKNSKNELDCVKKTDMIIVPGGRYRGTWIKLCFKYVLLFASDEQRQEYHAFRMAYITDLLRTLCKPKDSAPDENAQSTACNYEVVGSNSAVSDVDVTLYQYYGASCKKTLEGQARVQCDSATKLAETLRTIERTHAAVFEQPLDELFDCNLYLTSFFYYSKVFVDHPNFVCIKSGKSDAYMCFVRCDRYDPNQRLWAYHKIADLIERIEYDVPEDNTDRERQAHTRKRLMIEELMDCIQHLFPGVIAGIDAATKYMNEIKMSKRFARTRHNSYVSMRKSIDIPRPSRSVPMLPQTSDRSSSLLLSETSNLSTKEKDTYSTLGAALCHVVNKEEFPEVQEHLSVPLFVDAALDNLGFLFRMLIDSNDPCSKEIVILIKASKYIHRICCDIGGMLAKSGHMTEEELSRWQTQDALEAPNDADPKRALFLEILRLSYQANDNRKKLLPVDENRYVVMDLLSKLHDFSGLLGHPRTQTKMTGKQSALYECLKNVALFTFDMTAPHMSITGGNRRVSKRS